MSEFIRTVTITLEEYNQLLANQKVEAPKVTTTTKTPTQQFYDNWKATQDANSTPH